MGSDSTGRSNRIADAYAAVGGGSAVFSSKVRDYLRSRPGYPPALFDRLQQVAGIRPLATVADIGAGTGLLARGWLERGYRVIAVEPNAEMRAAADALLGAFPHYRALGASAEDTGIEAATVDLAVAGQAFHWFDPDAARAECLRILRPGGHVALIWNDRVLSDPVNVLLDAVFAQFGGAQRAAVVAGERDPSAMHRFFGDAAVMEFDLPHEQRLDLDGWRSLAFSRSYMPRPDSDEGLRAGAVLAQAFAEHANDEHVLMRYRTIAFVARLG